MVERPKDKKLKDALATYMKERLVPLIMADISAPEAFRLRTLLYALLDAVAPYSDPWVSIEALMTRLNDPSDALRKLTLEEILVDCTDANIIENHRAIPTGTQKFTWTESVNKVWSCSMPYGVAKIHPPDKGVDKYILMVSPADMSHESYNYKSDNLRSLMTIFENRCL
jgi:hypothetical protein